NEVRDGVVAGCARRDELGECIQKFIGAEVGGVGDLEGGKGRVKVSWQFGFRRSVVGQSGDGPGVGTRTAPGITNIFLQWLTLVDDRARANGSLRFGGSRGRHACSALGVAPTADNVFAIVAIRNSVRGEMFTKIAAGWLAGI